MKRFLPRATVITLSVLDTKGSVSSVPGTLSAVVTAGDDMAACLVYSPLPSDGLVVRFFSVGGAAHLVAGCYGAGGTQALGGSEQFCAKFDHNRYHISGFWARNRYHDECPGQ